VDITALAFLLTNATPAYPTTWLPDIATYLAEQSPLEKRRTHDAPKWLPAIIGWIGEPQRAFSTDTGLPIGSSCGGVDALCAYPVVELDVCVLNRGRHIEELRAFSRYQAFWVIVTTFGGKKQVDDGVVDGSPTKIRGWRGRTDQ
jgi:hypothetical protein